MRTPLLNCKDNELVIMHDFHFYVEIYYLLRKKETQNNRLLFTKLWFLLLEIYFLNDDHITGPL